MIRFLFFIWISITLAFGEDKGRTERHVLFFGDSITQAGVEPKGYISLIDQTIQSNYKGKSIKVTGEGIGGNKVGDLLGRVDRDVIAKKPTMVVLYVGTNDIWHWSKLHPVTKEKREGTTPEKYREGLEKLVSTFIENKAKVVICTPAVIGENIKSELPDTERLEQYSQIVRDVSVKYNAELLDMRKIFIEELEKVNLDNKSRGVLTTDGVHMNDAGNRLIAKSFCQLLGMGFNEKSAESEIEEISADDAPDEFYLLIGQSNMAGRARITKEYEKEVERAFLFDDEGNWVRASNPLNRYANIKSETKLQGVSPGYGFAQQFTKDHKDKTIGLLVNAQGGSKIQSWQKGAKLYEQTLERVKQAQKKSKLKGVLWHQGESNATDEDYLEQLTEVIEAIRKDTRERNLLFIAGHVYKGELVNDQISKLPETVKNTAYVKSEKLSTQDGVHFDAESQVELGKRYAKAMSKLLDE